MINPATHSPQFGPFRLTSAWKYGPRSGSHLVGKGCELLRVVVDAENDAI
jgi:hypothetical protein